MVASTPTKATLATSKLSSRCLRRRWNEARIKRLQLLHFLALTDDRSQGGALKLHAPDDVGSCVCVYEWQAFMSAFTMHMPCSETLILGRAVCPTFTDCASLTSYILLNPLRWESISSGNINVVFHSTRNLAVQQEDYSFRT